MLNDIFPKPFWVDLRIPISHNGETKLKLVARFDPTRGLLEVVERCEKQIFDLAQIIVEHQTSGSKHD